MAARLIGLLATLLLFAGCASVQREPQPRLLIFSHSTGFRHASIEPGVAAIEALARREGMTAVASEDSALFDTETLAGFDAIILLGTTTERDDRASEFLTGSRRTALQTFVRGGGGIVVIASAAKQSSSAPKSGLLRCARNDGGVC